MLSNRMTGTAILLVILAAFAHASWNMLAKRATTPEVFNWLMAAAGALVALPAALVLFIIHPPSAIGWLYIAGTIALHVLYFYTLGRAYRYGDLSIVYPVARGLGLTLIPILGMWILGESISLVAAAGIVAILVGIVTIGLSTTGLDSVKLSPGTLLNDRGFQYAILTGLSIGMYSVLDKRGVGHVTPILYMFFITAGGSSGMLAMISRDYTRARFAREFRLHWRAAIAGGVLQFSAYTLVLTALQLAPVSYVGPFRELAIAIGVVMGAIILKEKVTRGRAAGAAAVVAGALAIAVAP